MASISWYLTGTNQMTSSMWGVVFSGTAIPTGATNISISTGLYEEFYIVGSSGDGVIQAIINGTSTQVGSFTNTAEELAIQLSTSIPLSVGNSNVNLVFMSVSGSITAFDTPSNTALSITYTLPTTSYTVTYNPNNGSTSKGSESVTGGGTGTFPTRAQCTRSGYTLLGWSTSSSATTAPYLPGATTPVINSTTTYYAVWKANPTITYNANGGTSTKTSETVGYNGTGTFPTATQCTRSNATLLGWSTSSSATSAAYSAGATTPAVTANTTYYAVWKLLPVVTLTNRTYNGAYQKIAEITANAGSYRLGYSNTHNNTSSPININTNTNDTIYWDLTDTESDDITLYRQAEGTYYIWYRDGNNTLAYYVGSVNINPDTPELTFTPVSRSLYFNGSVQNIGTILCTTTRATGTPYYLTSTSSSVPDETSSYWTAFDKNTSVSIDSREATKATWYVFMKYKNTDGTIVVAPFRAGYKAIGIGIGKTRINPDTPCNSNYISWPGTQTEGSGAVTGVNAVTGSANIIVYPNCTTANAAQSYLNISGAGGNVSATSSNTNVVTVSAGTTSGGKCKLTLTYVAAGTATITVKHAASANYSTSTMNISVNATKKNSSLVISMSGYTYGNTPSTPSATTNTSGGTVTYYYTTSNTNSGGTAWSSSTTLNVGTYYMYGVSAATAVYNSATSAAVQFVIGQATPVLELLDSGTWTGVKEVWKMVGDQWVKQANWSEVFSTNTPYVKK